MQFFQILKTRHRHISKFYPSVLCFVKQWYLYVEVPFFPYDWKVTFNFLHFSNRQSVMLE